MYKINKKIHLKYILNALKYTLYYITRLTNRIMSFPLFSCIENAAQR